MEDEPLWMKIHHAYFYEDATLETIKDGIHQGITETKIQVNSLYNAVIRGAYMNNRLDVLEFIFSQNDFKRNEEVLTDHLSSAMMCRYFPSAEFLVNQNVKLDFKNPSVKLVFPFCSMEFLTTIRAKGFDIYEPTCGLLYYSLKEYPPRYDIMEDMLKLGANFNDIPTMDLYYHLLAFDWQENIDKIDYIISKGYDINKDDCQFLKAVISNSCEKILEHLLSIGININPKEGSLFQICAKQDNVKMFEILMNKGLTLDPNDDEVIKNAAQWENLEIIKFLIEKGFKVEVAQEFGEGKVKEWCIEQMHNQLTKDLPTNEPSKRKNKL
jgi:hypothetical protein